MKLYLGIDIGKLFFTTALCNEELGFNTSHPELSNDLEGWETLKQ